MPFATYFLGGRLLAQGPSVWWSHTEDQRRSLAYFCPSCGEIWARMWLARGPWDLVHRTCERCGPTTSEPLGEPGSFFHPWRQPPIDNLPRELLLYEANLRLKGL